jgi:hypothetical protein
MVEETSMKRAMFSIAPILMVIGLIGGLFSPIEIDAQGGRRPATQSQTAATPAERLNNMIVMIKCKIGDDESFGAGIIFGKRTNRLYISTANHIVRRNTDQAQNVRVQFKWLPGEWKAAELLDSTNRDLDLAVLAIDLSRENLELQALEWNQLGDPGLLKSGDSVYSVGYPNGEAWRTFETPNKIYKNTGGSIIFETTLVAPGNSGGALLNERREIVGMIREVDSSDGKAAGIQSVIETLREWNYPVDLKPSAGISKKTDAPSDRPSENAIYNFSARELSDSELAVSVDYQYLGGDSPVNRVTLNAYVPASDGKISRDFDYSAASGTVKRGGGRVTLTIKGTGTFTSTAIRISMVNESTRQGVVLQDFPYRKEWKSPTGTRDGSREGIRLLKSSFVLPDDGVSTHPRDSTDFLTGSCCRVILIINSDRTHVGKIYYWDASQAGGDPDSHVSHGYQLQLWAARDLSDPHSELVSQIYNAFVVSQEVGTEEYVQVGGLSFGLKLLAARTTFRRDVYLNSVRIQVHVLPIASNRRTRP